MIEQGDYFVVERGYRCGSVGGPPYDRSYVGWVFRAIAVSGKMMVSECVHIPNAEHSTNIGKRFSLSGYELELHRVGQGYLDALDIKPAPQRKGVSACKQ